MKIQSRIMLVTRIAAAVAFVAVLLPAQSEAAGKPTPPTHIEFKIEGPIFTLPDHTARTYPDSEWDQCREGSNSATGLGQQLTTMDLTALGYGAGVVRKAISLDFGSKIAGLGSPAVFSFWTTKNCQLLVAGYVSAGQWPLLGGSPGPELVVTIPAGAQWTFDPYGGAPGYCRGSFTISQDVTITIRRNEARTGNVCDCPNGYKDADVVACP